MYKVFYPAHATNEFTDVSFRRDEAWPHIADMAVNTLFIGDETCGPNIAMTSIAPGVEIPLGPAHGHAADNFRISLHGSFTMGRTEYGPGEFRLQEGWKPYPSDNSSNGPDGGWEIVLMADKRGTMARPAQADLGELAQLVAQIGPILNAMFDIGGDVLDLDDSCGPSALATTLGNVDNSGKLNGTFADTAAWRTAGTTKAAVSLLGDPAAGPVIVLSSTAPGETAMSAVRLDTEVFQLVISGSCEIGGRDYHWGDARVQHAGVPFGPVVAGPHGVQLLAVVGDRRGVDADLDGEGWLSTLGSTVRELSGALPATAAA